MAKLWCGKLGHQLIRLTRRCCCCRRLLCARLHARQPPSAGIARRVLFAEQNATRRGGCTPVRGLRCQDDHCGYRTAEPAAMPVNLAAAAARCPWYADNHAALSHVRAPTPSVSNEQRRCGGFVLAFMTRMTRTAASQTVASIVMIDELASRWWGHTCTMQVCLHVSMAIVGRIVGHHRGIAIAITYQQYLPYSILKKKNFKVLVHTAVL